MSQEAERRVLSWYIRAGVFVSLVCLPRTWPLPASRPFAMPCTFILRCSCWRTPGWLGRGVPRAAAPHAARRWRDRSSARRPPQPLRSQYVPCRSAGMGGRTRGDRRSEGARSLLRDAMASCIVWRPTKVSWRMLRGELPAASWGATFVCESVMCSMYVIRGLSRHRGIRFCWQSAYEEPPIRQPCVNLTLSSSCSIFLLGERHPLLRSFSVRSESV